MNKATLLLLIIVLLIIATVFGCNKTIHSKVSSGYLKSFGKVCYAPMGNSFELGIDELPYADVKTFKPLSEDYGKDLKRVYFTSNLIKGADPSTFKVRSFDYAVNKNNSYYSGILLNGISPDGFFPLSNNYFQSVNHYYYKKSNFDGLKTISVNSYEILTASNHSFKIIDTNLNLSTDGVSVFYYEYRLPLMYQRNFSVKKQEQTDGPFFHNGCSIYFISDYRYPNAIKSSLKKIKSSFIIPSQNKTYYLFKYDGINELNCNSEWAIVNNNALYYIKDKSLVFVATIKKTGTLYSSWSQYAIADDTVYYYDGNVNELYGIIKIDNTQKDFKLMNDFYAKNNRNVYYKGKIIPKADVSSFKALTSIYGYDKRFIFEGDSLIMDNTESNLEKVR